MKFAKKIMALGLVAVIVLLSGCGRNVSRFEGGVQISFETYGGTVIDPQTYTDRYDTLSVETPIKEGYIFSGWFLDTFYERPFRSMLEIFEHHSPSVTLLAKWISESYKFNIYYTLAQNEQHPAHRLTLFADETIAEVSESFMFSGFSIILTSMGRVFTSGKNFYGQTGNQGRKDIPMINEITHLFHLSEEEVITSVKSSISSVAVLTSHGRLFMWGNNGYGQLGDGTQEVSRIPIEISENFNLNQNEKIINFLLLETYTMALTSEGRLFKWGLKNPIAHYDSNIIDRESKLVCDLMPTDITPYFSLDHGETITLFSAGQENYVVVTSKNRVFTFGKNRYANLGDGTRNDSLSPIDITNNFTLEADESFVAVSMNVATAITTNKGRIFIWSTYISLGVAIGRSEDFTLPVDITSEFDLAENEIIIEVFISSRSMVFTSHGRILVWGHNNNGEIGIDGTETVRFPIEINVGEENENIDSIHINRSFTMVLTSEKNYYIWGTIHAGMLGNESKETLTTPTKIDFLNLELLKVESFAFNSPITIYQHLEEHLEFDDWLRADSSLPITINTMPNNHIVVYTKRTPMIYTVDYELDGGTNHKYNISTYTIEDDNKILHVPKKEGHTFLGWFDNPAYIGDAFSMVNAKQPQHHVFYAKWRINEYHITYVDVDEEALSLPQIPLYPQETIIGLSESYDHSSHTIFLTSLHRILAWGNNSYGQLGDGTNINRLSPVDITHHFHLEEDERIIRVITQNDTSAAISSKGRLFTWGHNGRMQLGNGTNEDTFSPYDITQYLQLQSGEMVDNVLIYLTQILITTSMNRVFHIESNFFHVEDDDSKFTYKDFLPQDITHHFGFAENESIIEVAASYLHVTLLTSCGRIFTWGNNSSGQLGDGTTNKRSTPTEITSMFNLSTDETIVKLVTFERTSYVVTSNSRIFTWGRNISAVHGSGIVSRFISPVEITADFDFNQEEEIIDIALWSGHAVLTTSQNRIFYWGRSYQSHLGTNDLTPQELPVDISHRFNLHQNESIEKLIIKQNVTLIYTSLDRILSVIPDGWGLEEVQKEPIDLLLTYAFDNQEEVQDISITEYGILMSTSQGRIIAWEKDQSEPRQILFVFSTFIEQDTYYYNEATEPLAFLIHGLAITDWYEHDGISSPYDFGLMPSRHVILYRVPFVQVNYLNDTDDLIECRTYPNDVEIKDIDLIDINKVGHTLDTWQADVEYTDRIYKITFTPIFTINQYTITFDTNQGDHVEPITLDYNETIPDLVEPNRLGYLFIGWYEDEAKSIPYAFDDMPDKNITLYAHYSIIRYSISAELDGGNISYIPHSYTILDSIQLHSPRKDGHTFMGWFGNAAYDGTVIEAIDIGTTEDITLFAKWHINTYQLHYYMASDGYIADEHIILFPNETIIKVISNNDRSAVITSKGRCLTWGHNLSGLIGNEGRTNRLYPTDITNYINLRDGELIIDISFGYSLTVLLTSQGRVFTWGYTPYSFINKPTEFMYLFGRPNDDKVVSITAGGDFAAALTAKGNLFTWGWNNNGQLGNNTTDSSELTNITQNFGLNADDRIVEVVSNMGTLTALTAKGFVFTWGSHQAGLLGDDSTTNRLLPENITHHFDLGHEEKVTQLYSGLYVSIMTTSNNRIFMLGSEPKIVVWPNVGTYFTTPFEITDLFDFDEDESVDHVSIGTGQIAVLTTKGQVYTYGYNSFNELGDPSVYQRDIPIESSYIFDLQEGETIIDFSFGICITTHGNLFTWGKNLYGQLGIGSTDNLDSIQRLPIATLIHLETNEHLFAEHVSLDEPLREGYAFNGWYYFYDQFEAIDNLMVLDKDIVLIAIWDPIT